MSADYERARGRLETYISECVLGHLELDILRLRRLEADLCMEARREVSPF